VPHALSKGLKRLPLALHVPIIFILFYLIYQKTEVSLTPHDINKKKI
jgi:hypothetical protein